MIKFILHGGFSFGKTDEDNGAFYSEILKDVLDGVKILQVMFAKDDDRIASAIVKINKEFENVKGTKAISITVATKEDFINQIKDSDVIYFHGGVSLKLLEALKQYPELESALKGKIVAGESAGANVWCKYFYSRKSDRVSEGLGFLPIKLIPHYQEEFAHKMDNIDSTLEEVHLPEYQHKVFQNFDVKKSLILPFNSKKEILIQDRRGHKKPDWGFFGGSIEKGETPLEAVIRETQEELTIDLQELYLIYLGTSITDWDGVHIIRYLYLYPTEQVEFDVREGKGGHWMSFDEAREKLEDPDRFDEVVAKIKQKGV